MINHLFANLKTRKVKIIEFSIRMNLSILILILFFFNCSRVETTKVSAKSGQLDLQSIDFEKKSVYLDGEWEFYPFEFIEPNDSKKAERFLQVPSSWNKEMKGSYGFASFRLKVRMPSNVKEELVLRIPEQGTAYSLFINGKFIAKNGTVSKDPSNSNPEFFPIVTKGFIAESETEILMHISNYEHREGGFWYSVLLGKEKNIKLFREDSLLLDLFLCGSILIMGIYHIGLFIIRKKDYSPLFFGMFCIIIIFRLLSQSEKYIVHIIPEISFRRLNQMEYLSYYLALPSFASFLYTLFPNEFSRKVLIGIWAVVISFCSSVIFTSTNFYTSIVIYFHLFTVLTILKIIYVFIKSYINKRESVLMLLSGTIILVGGTVNDILHSIELIHTAYIVPQSLLGFIFIQSIVLSIRFSKAFYENEKLINEMVQINNVNKRFVPTEFLEILGKKNFSEIKLGDQIQKKMTILFSDIRDFTTISEKMNPKENFEFINYYLSRMGPLVRKHNGFIDKFIGDAIMALYDSPDDAIRSALEMQKELVQINQALNEKWKTQIEIGIGIHSGNLMMGVVGEEERFDGTVISDAVNVASRIEGLTKLYHSKILVSEDVLLELKDDFLFSSIKIDMVKVKGKSMVFGIYEILDDLDSKEVELLSQTKLAFETGIECFMNQEFKEAKQLFEKVLAIHPKHSSANLYLQRCQKALQTNLSE